MTEEKEITREETIKVKVCKEDGTFGDVDVTITSHYDVPTGEWAIGYDAMKKIDETKLEYCLKNCKRVNMKDWCKHCFKRKRLDEMDKWLTERIKRFNEACKLSEGGLQTFKGESKT